MASGRLCRRFSASSSAKYGFGGSSLALTGNIIYIAENEPDGFINSFPKDTVLPLPLEHGDLAWFGVEGMVGGERKTLKGIVRDMKTGRLYTQLDGMARVYKIRYLFVEGQMRMGREKLLEIRGYNPNTRKWEWMESEPAMMYRELDNRLNTINESGLAFVKRSEDRKETAQQVMDAFHRHQEPNHLSIGAFHREFTPLGQLSLVARVAKEFPGIGWKRAATVSRHFMSVKEMVNAPAAEWAKMDGIGMKTGEGIVWEVSSHNNGKVPG